MNVKSRFKNNTLAMKGIAISLLFYHCFSKNQDGRMYVDFAPLPEKW